MKIFLTGGTGFVGRQIIAELKNRGHEILALVRQPNSISGVQEIVGDVTSRHSINLKRLRKCDAAIHLVGIIRQFPEEEITFDKLHVNATRNMLWTCYEVGIGRYLHMSALGANPQSASCYHRTKAEAEELVRTSQLDWTIIRPSVILGKDGEFFRMIRQMVSRRIVPLIGDGSSPMAPVTVATVAEAFVNALENRASVGKIYELGGEVLSYRQIMEKLAQLLNKRVIFIRMPVPLMWFVASRLDRFKSFPLSRGQISMMKEATAPQDRSIYNDLGLQFKDFNHVLKEVLSRD